MVAKENHHVCRFNLGSSFVKASFWMVHRHQSDARPHHYRVTATAGSRESTPGKKTPGSADIWVHT